MLEAKNKDFIQKTGKWRRWQTNVSKITTTPRSGCQVLYRLEDEEGEEGLKGRKSCTYLLEWPALERGCVNFFPATAQAVRVRTAP